MTTIETRIMILSHGWSLSKISIWPPRLMTTILAFPLVIVKWLHKLLSEKWNPSVMGKILGDLVQTKGHITAPPQLTYAMPWAPTASPTPRGTSCTVSHPTLQLPPPTYLPLSSHLAGSLGPVSHLSGSLRSWASSCHHALLHLPFLKITFPKRTS